MSELDPFFNDEALVKGITKDSRRLRPYGTVCVMPKYTSAIVNELVYCGTKSPLGMCNRKGTSQLGPAVAGVPFVKLRTFISTFK